MSVALIQSWFVEMILATGLLMILVLTVRQPVARHFGPRVAYALWLLPAMRAVLPPMPDAFVSVQGQVMEVLSSPLSKGSVDGISAALLLIWVLGAAAFFLWHSAAYARFSAHLRASAAPMFDDGRVKVARSPNVLAPLAFGVMDKAVIVPHDFAHRYDGREQYFAIDHELSHHRRGDLLANGFALILLSLHWFNPIAHIAFRAFRADQEAACDATVLIGASDADRHAYGRALVKSALGQAPLMACRISGGGVKARLNHIIAARDTAHMHEGGLFLAGILIFTGLGITASGGGEVSRKVTQRESFLAASAAHANMQADVHASMQANVQATAAIIGMSRFDQQSAEMPATQTLAAPQLAQRVNLAPDELRPAAPISADQAKALQDAEQKVPTQAVFAPVPEQQLAAIGVSTSQTPMVTAALTQQPKPAAPFAQSKCEASDAVMISEAVFVQGGNAQRVAMVLCAKPAPSVEVQRADIIASLLNARQRIAIDERLPIEARAQMIDMLELEIRRIEKVAA